MEPCEASSAAGSVCGGMQHGGGAPLPPHTFERAASVVGERRTEVRLREWPQHGKTLQLLFFLLSTPAHVKFISFISPPVCRTR